MQITPNVGIRGTFDDNIFSRETGLEEADFYTTLSPRLSLVYHWALLSAGVTYRGDLDIYAKNSQLNTYSQSANLKLNLDRLVDSWSKRSELVLTLRFIYTPDLPNYELDPGVEVEGDQSQLGRNNTFQNQFGALYRYRFSRQFRATADYSGVQTEYTDPGLVDRLDQSIEGGLAYDLSQRTSIFQTVSYQNILFDGKDRSDVYRATVGWEHSFTTGFSLRLDVGGIHIEEQGTENTRFFFSANLDKTIILDRDTKLSFSYVNDVRATGLTNRLVLYQSPSATLSKQFTRYLSGSINGRYSSSKTIIDQSVNNEQIRAGAKLSYLFRPWLSGNITYSYYKQNSLGDLGSNVRRNQVFIQMTALLPESRGF